MRPNDLYRRSSMLPAVLWFLFAVPAVAQSVTTLPSAPPSAEDDAVELSPFIVDDRRDVGYLAANTLAGSRLNTPLKDTPASISVLTAELLSDMGAFQLGEALAYAVNVENEYDDAREATNEYASVYNYPTYRVRGLPASVSRNYLGWGSDQRAIPDESAFVERIEDSRGPNSVLFGIGSPGGVINVNTKQAHFGRAFRKGTVTYGSYDSKRAAIDLNQPLGGGRLAARLILVYNHNNEFRHWAYQEHQRALLTGKYRLTERTRIRMEFERGQLQSNPPRSGNLTNGYLRWNSFGRPTFATVPSAAEQATFGLSRLNATQPQVTYISNRDMAISMRGMLVTTGAIPPGQEGIIALNGAITDRRISDFSINFGGPSQDRFTRYGIFTAIAEHQFAKNTFLELAYNHVDMSLDSRDPRLGDALYGDPNEFLVNGARNPYAGQVYLNTNWFRTVRHDQIDAARVTLSTEFDAGKFGNYRVAALGELDKSFIGSGGMREFWIDSATGAPAFYTATAENAQNRVTRRTYPVVGDWPSYHVSGPVGSAGGLLRSVTDPVTGRTLSSAWIYQAYPNEFYYTKKAGMVVLQGRYWKGRLVAAGGLRRDSLEEHQLGGRRNPDTKILEIARNPADADSTYRERFTRNLGTTKTLGFVYHVTPTVSLYYNRADNLAIPGKGWLRLPSSGEPGNPVPVPMPEGRGEDIGIGVELLEGRIYTKVSNYATKATNQSTTSSPVVRNANNRIMNALLNNELITPEEHQFRLNVGEHGIFDHSTEGWEAQVTANLTQRWRFQVNYAMAEAVNENTYREWMAWDAVNVKFLSQFRTDNRGNIVNANGDLVTTALGETIAEVVAVYQDELRVIADTDGIGKLGNRKHKVSLVTRYSFESGWLKGAYVGGAYRHQSKMFTGVNAELRPVFGNSFWRADLLAGYRVQGLRKGRQLSFQLNVYNVLNERDPLKIRYDTYGAVLREVVQPPTTWRFTTNFEY